MWKQNGKHFICTWYDYKFSIEIIWIAKDNLLFKGQNPEPIIIFFRFRVIENFNNVKQLSGRIDLVWLGSLQQQVIIICYSYSFIYHGATIRR